MVAGIHNLAAKYAGALRVIAKTEDVTLTAAEILDDGVPLIQCDPAAAAFEVTVPAASDKYKGRVVYFANITTDDDVTVLVAAGFGNVVANNQMTVASGEFGVIICDGSAWYCNGSTVPA